jgi:WD40 repeat protein
VTAASTDGGRAFVAATQLGELLRWTLGEGSPAWSTLLRAWPNDLVVRESLDEVIVAEGNGTILIRRLADGAGLGDPLLGHEGAENPSDTLCPAFRLCTGVIDISLTADGRLLASAGADATVRIWDLDRRETIDVLDIAASALAWSPDGAVLAIGRGDGSLRWWDTRSSAFVDEPVAAHSNLIAGAGFNGDGTVLATAAEDGTLRYWDPATHAAIGAPVRIPEGTVTGLAWSPDGQRLAVALRTGGVRIFESLPEDTACELATNALGDERLQEIIGDASVSCDGGSIAPAVPLLPAD